jgi:hypothetical protein
MEGTAETGTLPRGAGHKKGNPDQFRAPFPRILALKGSEYHAVRPAQVKIGFISRSATMFRMASSEGWPSN